MAKKRVKKRRVVKRRKTARSSDKKAAAYNKKAYWTAYKDLQQKAEKAWKKFKSSVTRKASPATIVANQNDLLLVLGECNYMARECKRLASKKR